MSNTTTPLTTRTTAAVAAAKKKRYERFVESLTKKDNLTKVL